MRRTTLLPLWLLLIAAQATSGCRDQPYLRLAEPLRTFPVNTDSACIDHQWIAIKMDPHTACPSVESMIGEGADDWVEDWVSEQLWTDTEATLTDRPHKEEFSPALGGCGEGSPFKPLACFCRYQSQGDGVDLAGSIGNLSDHGLLAMERDCMAVVPAQAPGAAPSAGGLAQRQSGTLERRFLAQAGRFERQSAIAVGAIAGPAPVRLAVVDTAPTSEAPPQRNAFNSAHGYVLLNMARKLQLLPTQGGAPAARLTSRLTLRFLELDRNLPGGGRRDTNGGFFGSLGDLAHDLRAEVADWQNDLRGGAASNLVLNLSLGWNERFNVLAPAAVAAVRAALADAVCRGALPIAAAGNQDWGADPTVGPIFPAAWETLATPTSLECTLLTGEPPPVSYARGIYRPLIYAIGAVGASGTRLPLSRIEAEPSLVAFGDHGLVTTPLEAEALTGSSVAALVASATATAAWSGRPDLSAFELMDRIYAASQPVTPTRRADFALDTTPRSVRRLFVCPVARALGGLTDPCPQQAGATNAPFPNPSNGLLTRLEPKKRPAPLDAGTQQIDLRRYTRETHSLVGCPPTAILDPRRPESAREWLRVRRSPAASSQVAPAPNDEILFPCPQWQAPAQWANAWVNPQPASNQCPTCGIEDGSPIGTAYLEIDSQAAARRRLGLPDPVLSNPTLKVGDTVYLLDELDLTGARPIRAVVEQIPLGQGDPLPVFFSLLLDGQLSSTSLLLGPEGLEPH